MEPADLVDLDRYPILDLDTPAARALIDEGRVQMRAVGAVELEGFVRADARPALIEDSVALAPLAHPSGGLGTVYLGFPDESFPVDHPQQWLGNYGVNAVAYDLFPSTSPMRQLYEWEPLITFVAAVLELDRIRPYADPLGALNLAVMRDGDELQWHFDQTDFVVSLAVQDAEQGGDFEVSPRIRTAADERYDAVARVLGGDHSTVVTLPMVPGTLLIFAGRHSLHRVSPIAGETPRLVGLFGYDTQPGTMSSELLKAVRYGRTEPVGAQA